MKKQNVGALTGEIYALHDHLDVCKRCAKEIFNLMMDFESAEIWLEERLAQGSQPLCPAGARLLKDAATSAGLDIPTASPVTEARALRASTAPKLRVVK